MLAEDQPPEIRSWKSTLFSFEGRIPRRTYWAGNVLTMAVVYPVMYAFNLIMNGLEIREASIPQALLLLALLLVPVALGVFALWVAFALLVKRCHDLNVSGYWSLVALVPLFGAIWAVVVMGCVRGTKGPNRYGLDPT